MVVIAVAAVIAAAGFVVILALVLLVTIGVHQEEKRLTFARRRGPTGPARLARLIVGRYVRPTEPEPQPASRSVAVQPRRLTRVHRARRPAEAPPAAAAAVGGLASQARCHPPALGSDRGRA